MYAKYWHINKKYLLTLQKKLNPPLLQLSRQSLDINQHKVFAKWMASIKECQIYLILASPPIILISNITVLLYLQDETINQIPFGFKALSWAALRDMSNPSRSLNTQGTPQRVAQNWPRKGTEPLPLEVVLLCTSAASGESPIHGLFRRTEISGNVYSFHKADLWGLLI